jgi:hypothetical protein
MDMDETRWLSGLLLLCPKERSHGGLISNDRSMSDIGHFSVGYLDRECFRKEDALHVLDHSYCLLDIFLQRTAS